MSPGAVIKIQDIAFLADLKPSARSTYDLRLIVASLQQISAQDRHFIEIGEDALLVALRAGVRSPAWV